MGPSFHSNAIPVIGFVAPSGTGKTTLLQKLVPVLRQRGRRIGYLKHAHHGLEVDRPGKDSHDIREAGALQVLLASSERWVLQGAPARGGQDPDLEEMLARFDPGQVDLILVEGFKYSAYPKIEIHRAGLGKPYLYPRDPDIRALITDETPPAGEHPPLLPLADPEAIADFILDYLARAPPLGAGLGRELVEYYRLLRQYGCNDSHSGNASVRDGEEFLVTPTGACADTLAPLDLIRCPLAGEIPTGASLDAPLHRLVYHHQPAARAVLHSHGPHAVALSLAGRDLAPADFEGQLYFPRVPVLDVPYADYVAKAPLAVAEALAKHPIAMVRGHGVYAWGESLNRAYKWTSSLELSAQTFILARQVGVF
jgi:L-fuculose-phosphate aldolase